MYPNSKKFCLFKRIAINLCLYSLLFINVHGELSGLAKENDECIEDSECESNHCLNDKCVCDRHKSVPIDQKCWSAEPLGGDCFHSEQCTDIAGPFAICTYKKRCRCSDNSFHVEVPHRGKYCVKPRVLYEKCSYSEECQAIGDNRYCNQDFICQCNPGHYHRVGIGCIQVVTNSISRTIPSISLWPLLVLTFAAYVY